MSVFAERRKGTPTGNWIVEVTIDGERHHARTKSHEEALRIEAELLATGKKPEPLAAGVYTLAHLDEDVRDKLWRDQADEEATKKRWRRCLAILGPETPVAEVRSVALERLVDKLYALKKPAYDAKTINRYISSVSKALRWAYTKELIASMPIIPRQKESVGRIARLRDDEVPKFVQWIWANEPDSTALCLETLLVTGMRLSELLTLPPENVEEAEGGYQLLLERTKNGFSRTVPLPDHLGRPLRALLASKVPDEDLLRRACHRATVELRLKDHITPHVLRHTAASVLIDKGVPSLVVADLLGHRSLITTRKYTHPSQKTLREATQVMVRASNASNSASKRGQDRAKTQGKSRFSARTSSLQSAPFAARDIPPCA